MKLHEKVLLYVNNNGIKQTWLAAQINISVKTLNSILLGRQRLTADMFELICRKGLKVDPSIFFNNEFLGTEKTRAPTIHSRRRPRPARETK